MPYSNDKINDVITILAAIKRKYGERIDSPSSASLRLETIKELAENELLAGRFIDKRSGTESLRDACTRRIKVSGIREFDSYIDQWLHENSMILRGILLQHSNTTSQRTLMIQFFGSTYC
jgi:hypothetical protein